MIGRLVAALLFLPVAASAELTVVVIEGLGGEPRYTERFAEQVAEIERAALQMTSAESVRVFRAGDFDRDDVLAYFEALPSRLSDGDRLQLYLIGHGSYDDHDYKFNIDGPDLTGEDLADMLAQAPEAAQLVVNTSSASGATADRLMAENRTLVLATRSGVERHATRFGTYFTAALTDASADSDKDGVISAGEAFRYAERQVADYYDRNGQLATEHPRIEGGQADLFSVARLEARPETTDSIIDRLLTERNALNDEIDALRLRRDEMTAEQYQSELLGRLVELASVEEQIEARQQELADEN